MFVFMRRAGPSLKPKPILENPSPKACSELGKKLIIVPAFNETENLAGVVEQGRHLTDWELLIVNDSSADNTANVIALL